jgi:hypothetical protein
MSHAMSLQSSKLRAQSAAKVSNDRFGPNMAPPAEGGKLPGSFWFSGPKESGGTAVDA